MAKKQDYTWLVWVAIIGVLIWGGQAGWFKGIINIGGGSTQSLAPAQPETEFLTYNVYVSFSPNTLCVGGSTTGSITSNIPTGVCSIFMNTGSGWNLLLNANLNGAGSYSESRVISAAGQARVRATCCDSSGNCKISNEASLTTTFCAEPPPDGSDESYGITCDAKCKSAGFVAGDGFPGLVPSDCVVNDPTEPWVYASLSGSDCCCLPAGGGTPPAADCSASCTSHGYTGGRGPVDSPGRCEGIELYQYYGGTGCCCWSSTTPVDCMGYCNGMGYQIGRTFTTTCSQKAQSECGSFGTTVQLYVSYSNNCCCINCNTPN